MSPQIQIKRVLAVLILALLLPLRSHAVEDQASLEACQTTLSPGTLSPDEVRSQITQLKDFVSSQVLDQHELVNSLLIALLVNGHVLVESPPGAAKTRAITTLASGIDGQFSRIQFVADTLPNEITGKSKLNSETHELQFLPGPIFGNFILADELNRATPKAQSALLQPMEERKVTIGGGTIDLPPIHLVLATQNPLDDQGTFKLPSAQLDRFILSLNLEYPSWETELRIIQLVHQERLDQHGNTPAPPFRKLSQEAIMEARRQVLNVTLPDAIGKYIVRLIASTRQDKPEFYPDMKDTILAGASPRASIGFSMVARAQAWLSGRSTVEISDVDSVALAVLRHRITLTDVAKFEGKNTDSVIKILIQRAKGLIK